MQTESQIAAHGVEISHIREDLKDLKTDVKDMKADVININNKLNSMVGFAAGAGAVAGVFSSFVIKVAAGIR